MSSNVFDDFTLFQRWALDYYQPQAIRHYDLAIARMLQALQPPPNSEVLDAGCGTGVHAIRVARAGFTVKAIDVSHVALSEATLNAERAGVMHRITFEHADLTQLPYCDESFATIFSWGVVIHIEHLDQALRELVRVLRPGGRIALQVTNACAIDHKIALLGRWALRQPPKAFEQTQFGPGAWDKGPEGRLWTVLADAGAMTECMERMSCRRTLHIASEFTELQRRASGLVRSTLCMLNRAWFALRLPAAPACTNLMVFEKTRCD